MNVLLIIPQFKYEYGGRKKANYFFPLGIAYISSYLKSKNYRVYNYNGAFFSEHEAEKALNNIIISNQIDIVGIGGLSAEFSSILFYSNLVKKINPSILLVLGGGFVTGSPKTAMELVPLADIGIIGQGEVVFEHIVDACEKKYDFLQIENIIYRNIMNQLVQNKYVFHDFELDSLPFPDYDGFWFPKLIDINESIVGERIASVIGSRSCPFSCTFCFHPSGEKYSRRSVDNILEEIEWLIKKYGITKVSLTDELFVNDKKYLYDFCEKIRKLSISWECCARVDSIDENILDTLKKANCQRISFGLESADDSVLKSMKKNINHQMISNALKLTRNAGIEAVGAFIFGDVREDMETAKRSLDYYLSHQEHAIDLNMLRVFPGSEDYKYALDNKIIEDELEYIRTGCPLINISKLKDQEFLELKVLIEDTIAQKKRLPLNVSFSKKEGQYLCKYKCPRCGSENIIAISRLSDVLEGFCCYCSDYFHFSVLDCYEAELIKLLDSFYAKNKEIILFPINNISIKIHDIYFQSRELQFYDTRYSNTKFKLVKEIKKNSIVINCSIGKKVVSSKDMIFIDDLTERLTMS